MTSPAGPGSRPGWRTRLATAFAVRRSRGRGGAWWWRGAAPVVFLLAGALFVTSWASSGGADLRGGRYDDLPGLAEAETRQLEQLRAQQEDLAGEVDRLSDDLGTSSGAGAAAEAARAAEGAAGVEPVRGPGVTITLSDAPDAVQDTAAGDDIGNLVVHQQDIQAVANALWAGGAEAMTIQGQRVVSNTGIRCVGISVVLHDVPYAPPYVISAIGPTDEMLRSINESRYIGFYLEVVERYQLGWELDVEPRIEMPGYVGSTALEHARPAGLGAPSEDDDL